MANRKAQRKLNGKQKKAPKAIVLRAIAVTPVGAAAASRVLLEAFKSGLTQRLAMEERAEVTRVMLALYRVGGGGDL